MKIKSVQFKNFASYGNKIQTIDFENSTGDLYLVKGSNGSGKSSLARVITYLCYGKVHNVNLSDLPNRVNNELWGKIILESKGNLIEIERGIKPSIFNVKINGTEYDVAGKTNMQEFLDTEMFEIPYHVFKNVIILSINDFKSFITMSPRDKKMIIDRIFGFSVINEMKEIIKEKRKKIQQVIRTFDDEIRTLNESIESVANSLNKLEDSKNEKSKKEIEDLKAKLIEYKDKRDKLVKANDITKKKISDKVKESKIINSKTSDANSEIKTISRGLTLYKNDSCPTCGSDLHTNFHESAKKEQEDKLEKYKVEVKKLKEEYNNIENAIKELRNKNKEIITKAGAIEADMNNFKNELIKISENKSEDSDHLNELINNFEEKITNKEDKKNIVESKDNYLTILESLMGEDGIKNMAIRSILPSLNNNVLMMGKEMGIPFSIKFDEKFNCTLNHLGEEISPKTLSTGERKKVDFVVIMSLIKMIKIRFPGLNILFLDEIFSSIDSSGVYHIIQILHDMIKEVGLNTFVINHTVLPSEYFDKYIEISKDGGFSEFTIETII